MKIERTTLTFWESELVYLKDMLEEQSGLIWEERIKRLIHRIEELEIEMNEKN